MLFSDRQPTGHEALREIVALLTVLQASVNEIRRDLAYLKADRCHECRREQPILTEEERRALFGG